MNYPETQKVDKNTNETVYQIKPPEKIVAELDNIIGIHSAAMNKFISMSQQFFALLEATSGASKGKEDAARRVNNTVLKTIKKMKLDRNIKWAYNIADKCLERREAPEVKALESLTDAK